MSADFFETFKRTTEIMWAGKSLDTACYGFQFQPGTRWNSGLSSNQIAEYESAISVRFPPDFKAFLSAMNGTDLPTINLYGSSGIAPTYSVGVFAYPKDLDTIMGRIADIRGNRDEIITQLAEQGFTLTEDTNLAPIFGHHYVACDAHSDNTPVLSIVINATDAIVYAASLEEYLTKEFISKVR